MSGPALHPWPELQAELPVLTDEERAGLAASIAEHGIQYPVLALPDGRIVDGHHRWQIAGEAAPIVILDNLTDEDAYALGLSLNADRRQLLIGVALRVRDHWRQNREAAKRAMVAMAQQGKTQQQIAEAIGYSQPRVSEMMNEVGTGVALSESDNATKPSPTVGHKSARKIPHEDYDVIRARLDAGVTLVTVARDYGVTEGAVRQFVQRMAAGIGRPGAKRRFTDAEEEEIEARYRAGETQDALTRAYGCGRGTIWKAVRRTRQRREAGDIAQTTTPPAGASEPPSNVVAFLPKPKRAAPPKPRFTPHVIQRASVSLLEEARRFHDRINALESQFGDDLIPALAGSAEGELIDEQCTALATRIIAFAAAIRRAGEHHSHDSTGS